jgi:hypothetical protein
MKLIRESRREGFAKLSIYELIIGGKEALKIDFVLMERHFKREIGQIIQGIL